MATKFNYRISIILFVFFVFFLDKNVPAVTTKTRISPPDFEKIRILLDSGQKRVFKISYNSRFPVNVIVDNELAFRVEDKSFSLSSDGKHLKIGHISVKGSSVQFQLRGTEDYFTYKNYKFFYSMQAVIDSDGKTYLIHMLPLEDYISRVLLGEMPRKAHEEALKAQAIASRTYCCYNILERRIFPYDLTLESQAFGPNEGIQPSVQATSGMVITLREHIVPAFFHTNCGGFTEYSVNVWRTYYHYSQIIECPYCRNSKHFSWKAKFSYSEIERLLRKGGYNISPVTAVFTYSVNPKTHRTTQVIVKSPQRELTLSANTFRLLVDSRKLKSTYFSVTNSSGYAEFEGRGYGHGVGMCQDGAQEMARKGFSAEDILRFYFPETKIKKIY
ncbi:MAG: SpoIID/LytB domain-containing protein [Candidatus Aureabacteria bacterium]|nr:SpoIID/LytB domain-containing protein [Candidatus Auribacterota bacterium]